MYGVNEKGSVTQLSQPAQEVILYHDFFNDVITRSIVSIRLKKKTEQNSNYLNKIFWRGIDVFKKLEFMTKSEHSVYCDHKGIFCMTVEDYAYEC